MNNINIENTHPRMVWEYIKGDIEFRIILGELRVADRVPSIAELSDQYNVSKTTAQKVLEDMFSEGTINKAKGVGYFVKPYMKDILTDKHKNIFVRMVEECISYAHKLDIDSKGLEDLKETIVKSFPHRED